nr:MAG TPA: hypothetical protein [Caudoviricetes sp.]
MPLIVPVTPKILTPERMLVAMSFACSVALMATLPEPSW